MPTVDVNVLLGKDALELTIKDKTFTIKDIPFKIFLEAIAKKDGNVKDLRQQFAEIAEVDISELDNIGPRAIALAMVEIRKWLTGAGISAIVGDLSESRGKDKVRP